MIGVDVVVTIFIIDKVVDIVVDKVVDVVVEVDDPVFEIFFVEIEVTAGMGSKSKSTRKAMRDTVSPIGLLGRFSERDLNCISKRC